MKLNKRWIIFFVFIGLIILFRFSGVSNNLTIANFKMNSQWFKLFVLQHYKLAVLEYILLYILVVSLSLPIAAVLTLAGGYLFGTLLATLYTNIGATIGSLIAFLMMRYLIGEDIQTKYEKQLIYFNKMVKEHGVFFLLFSRFVAVVPLFLITILAAISNISLFNFIWTTSVGIIPGSLVYAFAGGQLHKINTIKDVFSPSVLLAFLLLGLLALMPVIIKKLRKS